LWAGRASSVLKILKAGALFLALLSAGPANAGEIPPHAIVAYLDSWNEPPATSAIGSSLASLPSYITVVDLAFAKPDLLYTGNLDLLLTGLEYRYSGHILRDAIALLKLRVPATRVLLSVGGAAYTDWQALNEVAIARLVQDLHADGVDIDYEPRHPGCAMDADQHIRCAIGPVWRSVVMRLRTVLPRPALLTASVWSVGAYGEGVFADSAPTSRYTGMMLGSLRSPEASEIDMLSINAYDAGPRFNPMEAYRAYRAAWPGVLALGLEVRRRGGDGPFYSAAAVELLAGQVARDGLGAMMVYPLLAKPEGQMGDRLPDGFGLARAMCRGMALGNCDDWPR
jgi:chitinase